VPIAHTGVERKQSYLEPTVLNSAHAAVADVCALGAAALVLSGLARTFPGTLAFLRDPDAAWHAVTTALAWLVMAATGWATKRKRVRERSRTGDRRRPVTKQ
jgi:hypothetical protein